MKKAHMLWLALPLLVGLAACGGGNSSAPVENTPPPPPPPVVPDGKVLFKVTHIPSNHPADADIYLAGTMNGWKPGLAEWKLKKAADGSYQIEVPFAKAGATEQFKFTRGAWAQVELDADGYDVKNRTFVFDGQQTVLELSIGKWLDLEGSSKGRRPTATGNIKIHELAMPQFDGQKRNIRVYLPADYDKNTQSYPVLYMFDGKNLYDEATSAFGMEWQVDEALEKLGKEGGKQAIVVGIDAASTGKARYQEYTAWNWTHPSEGAIVAQGDKTADFVVNTVMPFVNSTYRTYTDRAHTGLAGSSMGGYISIYTGVKYADKFSKVASFSTVALDDPMQGQLLRAYVEASKPLADTKVYLDIGDQEKLSYAPQPQMLVDGNQKMGAAFTKAAYTGLRCEVIAGGTHDELAWSKRFSSVFQWLY